MALLFFAPISFYFFSELLKHSPRLIIVHLWTLLLWLKMENEIWFWDSLKCSYLCFSYSCMNLIMNYMCIAIVSEFTKHTASKPYFTQRNNRKLPVICVLWRKIIEPQKILRWLITQDLHLISEGTVALSIKHWWAQLSSHF